MWIFSIEVEPLIIKHDKNNEQFKMPGTAFFVLSACKEKLHN